VAYLKDLIVEDLS